MSINEGILTILVTELQDYYADSNVQIYFDGAWGWFYDGQMIESGTFKQLQKDIDEKLKEREAN